MFLITLDRTKKMQVLCELSTPQVLHPSNQIIQSSGIDRSCNNDSSKINILDIFLIFLKQVIYTTKNIGVA